MNLGLGIRELTSLKQNLGSRAGAVSRVCGHPERRQHVKGWKPSEPPALFPSELTRRPGPPDRGQRHWCHDSPPGHHSTNQRGPRARILRPPHPFTNQTPSQTLMSSQPHPKSWFAEAHGRRGGKGLERPRERVAGSGQAGAQSLHLHVWHS